MGLDMYLTAKRYLSAFDEKDKEIGKTIQNLFPELEGRTSVYSETASCVSDITVRVGYWRKANAIHRWFVDNVQEGQDDCKSYGVYREELENLKSTCQEVLSDRSKAQELLPTTSGFFFGGTEYDEWYFNGLQNTINIIDNALSLSDDWEFEYQSSW